MTPRLTSGFLASTIGYQLHGEEIIHVRTLLLSATAVISSKVP